MLGKSCFAPFLQAITVVSCLDSLNVASTRVGKESSGISCDFPSCGLCRRMRRGGRVRLLEEFSFSSEVLHTNNRRESSSIGKEGAIVVRGDSPKVGIFEISTSLVLEGGVGIARKDRSLSLTGCSVSLEKRSSTSRPGRWQCVRLFSSFIVECRYLNRGMSGGERFERSSAASDGYGGYGEPGPSPTSRLCRLPLHSSWERGSA